MTFCRWLVLTVLLATTVGCDDLAGSRSALGPGELREIGIEQKIGDAVPLDASFTDAAGRPVTLGRLLGERPVILALVYNRCPMLCTRCCRAYSRASRSSSSARATTSTCSR